MFSQDIKKFNGIYLLPVNAAPTLAVSSNFDLLQRLKDFKNILAEEVEEIEEIISMVEHFNSVKGCDIDEETATKVPKQLDILTALADLLGDIQVYCASEMAKFGLPQDAILDIIMQSNFSKLGTDGNPIYDVRGKVQKGPNYWKPEPAIKKLLATKIAAHVAA